jgi:predicted DNA-binding protein (MmcQ/YjbR family)
MAGKKPATPEEAALREHALTYPEAYEEFPWGERAMKVNGKVFVFLSYHEGGFNVTAKLPVSGPTELLLPFASPTGYGLGKSGWVTARFAEGEEIPLPLLKGWIDESYRAVAPKKLLAKLLESEADAESATVIEEPPKPKAKQPAKKRTKK